MPDLREVIERLELEVRCLKREARRKDLLFEDRCTSSDMASGIQRAISLLKPLLDTDND